MNHYIFNSSPVDTFEGKLIPAVQVIRQRLGMKYWPLNNGTHHKDRVSEGDVCVFYAAGYHTSAKCFVGSAKIKKIHLDPQFAFEPKSWMTDVPYKLLELDDVVIFEDSVYIKKILSKLSFITDPKRWGIQLQGGVKLISESDFAICIQGKS